MGNVDHANSDRMEGAGKMAEAEKIPNQTPAFWMSEPSASFRTIAVAVISLLPVYRAIVRIMKTLCQPIRKDPVVILHHQLDDLVLWKIVDPHELLDAIYRVAAVVWLALVPYPDPDLFGVVESFPASHVP